MNQDEKIDLSPLDPGRHPERWRRVVSTTLDLLDPVLAQRRRQDPLTLIAEWSRPLIIASITALAFVVPIELALEIREEKVEQVQRLVELTNAFEYGNGAPSGADFLRALTEEGEPR